MSDNEMFNVKPGDKFYLRSDAYDDLPGSFCNGIYYLPNEEQIKPEDIAKLLNKLYSLSDINKNIINSFLMESIEKGDLLI